MAEELLTLVVPAYNVERYICDCLESVVDQCIRYRVPLVVVVDGATDRTEDKVRSLLAAHCYVDARVLVQENRGLSGARNRGLELVDTEYVTFLDSDDLWSDDYLARVMPILCKRRPDILEYNAALISDDGKVLGALQITPVRKGELKRMEKSEFLRLFRCYAWARVTRTEIVRRYPFPVGERFEDAGAVPWHYWAANRIDGLGVPLVYYRQHRDSILALPRTQDVYDLANSVHRASQEYLRTGAGYWKSAAGRIHQIGCRRTLSQPRAGRRESVRALTAAVAGTPPNPGLLRWLQLKRPYLYISLLLVKSHVVSCYWWLLRRVRP